MKTVIRGIGQIVSGAIAAPLVEGDTIVCVDGKIQEIGDGSRSTPRALTR